MTRDDLAAMLNAYDPPDAGEAEDRFRMLVLLQSEPACFERSCFVPGHITGSALLVSGDGRRALMNHHKSLNKWLCFGGHADGEADILSVARREGVEESGIERIEPAFGGIFDLDIHPIPANLKRNEPAHEHFDIRYLFRVTGRENFTVSDESHDMKWCGYDEAVQLAGDDGMRRLLRKWRDRVDQETGLSPKTGLR